MKSRAQAGRTALIAAAKAGLGKREPGIDFVRRLLTSGAELHAVDKVSFLPYVVDPLGLLCLNVPQDWNTALSLAIEAGDGALATVLLERDRDPSRFDIVRTVFRASICPAVTAALV
jgi:hypothetical protein